MLGLQEDVERERYTNELIVWDRGWPSDHVYSSLLGRDRRLRDDPWLGEWLYGRAFQTRGLRVILAGPSADVLKARRVERNDPTDLPVDPAAERAAYVAYGQRFGWKVVETHDAGPLETMGIAEQILAEAQMRTSAFPTLHPPDYVGPVHAQKIFLGEFTPNLYAMLSRDTETPGAWLAGTNGHGIALGRLLGDEAFLCGWMTLNARSASFMKLATADCVYTVGSKATAFAERYAREVIELPSPRRWTGVPSDILISGSSEALWRQQVVATLESSNAKADSVV